MTAVLAQAGWVRYPRPTRSHYYKVGDSVSVCELYGDVVNARVIQLPPGDACGHCWRRWNRLAAPPSEKGTS